MWLGLCSETGASGDTKRETHNRSPEFQGLSGPFCFAFKTSYLTVIRASHLTQQLVPDREQQQMFRKHVPRAGHELLRPLYSYKLLFMDS